MQNWLTPRNIKLLHGFLGLIGYYRKFVKNYGKISIPLTSLLEKDVFQWLDRASADFDKLEAAMTTTPVLTLPDFNRPFIIEADTSGVTMVFLPKDSVQGASFDLHVLSTPPAFILSQDQTLVKSVCSVRMTLAIHPLLLFWKSLASITRINNVRSENFILNFQGWLLFNYQCSCLLSLCDSLFIISHLQSLVNNFFIFLFQEFLSFFRQPE